MLNDEQPPGAQVRSTPDGEQKIKQVAPQQSAQLRIVETNLAQPNLDALPLERVRQALSSEPECSDRELGKLSGMSAATAKKYRLVIEQERAQVISSS